VSELMLAASSVRTAITENSQNAGTINVTGISTPAPVGKVSAVGIAASTGVITIAGVNAEFGSAAVSVTLTPSWNASASTVTWSCDVSPANLSPSSCRQD